MRTFRTISFVAVVVGTALIPGRSAAAAAPDLSGFVPDFTKAISFLADGQSETVSGVNVTASENTGVRGDRPTTFLHQSNSRLRTVLTFDPPIPGFQAEVRLNADCDRENCFEQYELVGKDSSGTVVFETTIRNDDGVFPYVPGDGAGQLSGLIASLEIDYTHDTPIGDLLRGSYLDLKLSDTYIRPATQTVNGATGAPIVATTPFTPTGFAGDVTYTVTDGELPAGLQLDPATGVISGTPTGESTATVTITATGATRGSATATISFNIAVGEVPGTVDEVDVVAVVADSRSLGSGSSVPRIGFSTNPPVDADGWTALPVCAVYAADDANYSTPLTGVLSVGAYVTHCSGGESALFDVGSYSNGTFTVTAPLRLPETGLDPWKLMVISLLFLGVGLGLAFAGRPRTA